MYSYSDSADFKAFNEATPILDLVNGRLPKLVKFSILSYNVAGGDYVVRLQNMNLIKSVNCSIAGIFNIVDELTLNAN
jgi:hypothetical protein